MNYIEHFRLCAGDPMWADHVEMNKGTLLGAANEMERLQKELQRQALDYLALDTQTQQLTAERDALLAAVTWALGTNGEFRTQGTMDGKYWWRGELAERAGLRWDGERWTAIDAARKE